MSFWRYCGVSGVVLFFLLLGCTTETRVVERSNIKIKNSLKDEDAAVPKSKAEMIQELQRAWRRDPDSPRTAWRIGWYYFHVEKRYAQAEHWFRYSIGKMARPEEYPGPYYYLGEACMRQGKIREAVECFEKVIRIRRSIQWEFRVYRMSYFNLGILYAAQKRMEKSNWAFDQYIKLGGDLEKVRQMRYRIQQLSKNSVEGLR
ncbi:MAG: tetratricopeptide repeat protein [Planctomycetota bacterium]|nr:MAG: tetratricopeptide repeat protein [Planctomycetota bacterium]